MLADKLRLRIQTDGPMPFEEFMAACLYDEEFGFFATGPLRSVKSGDFLTSPEVSPWLGRMLARFVGGDQKRTGAIPFLVVEIGAGSGSLLKPLIETLQHVPPAAGRGDAERSDAGGRLSSSPSGGGAERSEAEGVEQVRSEPSDPPPGLAAGLPPEGGEKKGVADAGRQGSPQPTADSQQPESMDIRSAAQSSSSPSGGGADEGGGGGQTPRHAAPIHVPPVEGRGDAERSDAGGPSYVYHAIEASPAARVALTDLLGLTNVHHSLDDLPDHFDGVIIANELLDNLPVALAIRSGDGWVERWVGATDDRFGFVTAPARPDVVAWCDAYAGTVPEGGMVEVQLAATEWIESALQHIDHGTLIVIDYGGTAEELEPRRTQGTLRTYRSHHLGPDPLLEPGETDVTVDVNFTAMLAAVEAAGATAELHRQDDFLANLGLRETIRDLRHRERDLARSGDAMERLIVRSEATDAETLLHPRGLGDFRVMVAEVV